MINFDTTNELGSIIARPAAGAAPRRHLVVSETSWRRLFSLKLAQNYKLLHHRHEKQNKQKLSFFLLFLFLHKLPSGKKKEKFSSVFLSLVQRDELFLNATFHKLNIERKQTKNTWSELICFCSYTMIKVQTRRHIWSRQIRTLYYYYFNIIFYTRLLLRFKTSDRAKIWLV